MTTDSIVGAFETLADRAEAAPLVVSPDRSASRGDVRAAARALGASIGSIDGAYVLLSSVNGAGFLAALLAIRHGGGVPVLMDRSAPAAERERVLEALDVPLSVRCDDPFPRDRSAFLVERHADRFGRAPEGAGYVKMTSGSTGAPAGVAIGADALAADDDQLAETMGLRADDRFLAVVPWSHAYGLSSLVLPALRRGSVLVIPRDGGPWSPLAAAEGLGATVFPTVPVYLQSISTLAEPPRWPDRLRTVISAGAPLLPETAARFRERFSTRVHVFLGASECGGIAYDREGGAAERGTVGTPVAGVEVGLENGSVTVRSRACGLRHVPEASERLAGGVFRSADLGAWTGDGELVLRGRADGLINAGGKKVQPGEVEVVLRAMPGVREAVVVGVKAAGGGREIVRAIVACDPGTLTYAAVTNWCRARLAAHKVPRSVVLLGEIPRTSRGKIDREALLAPALVEER